MIADRLFNIFVLRSRKLYINITNTLTLLNDECCSKETLARSFKTKSRCQNVAQPCTLTQVWWPLIDTPKVAYLFKLDETPYEQIKAIEPQVSTKNGNTIKSKALYLPVTVRWSPWPQSRSSRYNRNHTLIVWISKELILESRKYWYLRTTGGFLGLDSIVVEIICVCGYFYSEVARASINIEYGTTPADESIKVGQNAKLNEVVFRNVFSVIDSIVL